MDVICFGQMNWDWCWTGKQHLVVRLNRRGHRVLYVNPQRDKNSQQGILSLGYPEKDLMEIEHQLYVHSYPCVKFAGWKANAFFRSRSPARVARHLGFTNVAAIAFTPYCEAQVRCLKPASLIYYATDEVSAFAKMTDSEQADATALEQRLASRADICLGISSKLTMKLKEINPESYCIPSGVDIDHFSEQRLAGLPPHPLLRERTGPVIGFMGQIDERLDQEIIRQMALAHPEWTVVLAGRVKEGVSVERLGALRNVILAGYIDYDSIPQILNHFTVCCIPYVLNRLTNSCSPLKAFEWLPSGRPIVATPLEGLRPLLEVIDTAATPEEFVRAVESALLKEKPGRREKAMLLAQQSSWDAKCDKLEEYLERSLQGKKRQVSYVKCNRRLLGERERLYAQPAQARKIEIIFPMLFVAGWIYLFLRVCWRVITLEPELFIRKILITRRARIGDAIVFLPALQELRKLFPSARIVLGWNASEEILEKMRKYAPVDEVRKLSFHRSRWNKKLLSILRLFLEGFDLTVTGAGYFHMEEALLSGAPFRAGLAESHPLDRFSNRLLRLDMTISETENSSNLFAAIGGEERAGEPVHEETAALPVRKSRGTGHVIIHPGAQKPSRRWPPEYFTELAASILVRHPELSVRLTGTNDDWPLAQQIILGLPSEYQQRATNAAGATSLGQLEEELREASLAVCNDTGVMHLAREVGAPLLALLGPENDLRWGPAAEGAAPAIGLRHVVPCAPCSRMGCDRLYCMRCLKPAVAAESAEALIAGNSKDNKLKTTRSHVSWRDLKDQGFDIPLVSIIVDSRGGMSDRRLAAAHNLSYPNYEIVPADHIFLSNLFVSLKTVKGEFISFFNSNSNWSSWKISDDVAALIRNPSGNVAACAPFTNRSAYYADRAKILNGWATFRAGFLRNRISCGSKCYNPVEWVGDEPVLLRHQQFVEMPEKAAKTGYASSRKPCGSII